MPELWKIIEGTDKAYSVSDWGRVRRNGGVGIKCRAVGLLRTRYSSGGVARVSLSIPQGDGRAKTETRTVKRLVADAFLPPCPEGYVVTHTEASKTLSFSQQNERNVVESLEWVSRSELARRNA